MNNNILNDIDIQKIKDYIYDIQNFNNKCDIINFINHLKLIMIENKLIIENLDNSQISVITKIIDNYSEYNLSYEIIGFTKKVLLISNKSHLYFNNDFEIYNKDETIPLLNTNINNQDSTQNKTYYDYNNHFISDSDSDSDYQSDPTTYSNSRKKLTQLKEKTLFNKSFDYFKDYSKKNIESKIQKQYQTDTTNDTDKELLTKLESDINKELRVDSEENTEKHSHDESDEDSNDESEEDSNDESGEQDIDDESEEELNINQNDIVLNKLYNNNDYIFTKGESVIYVICVLNLFINLYMLNFK